MKTWRQLITETLKETNENFDDLVINIPEGELDRKFDNGLGNPEGSCFTAWGPQYVYFPLCYDGSEWVGYAPRNPCEKMMEHQGE